MKIYNVYNDGCGVDVCFLSENVAEQYQKNNQNKCVGDLEIFEINVHECQEYEEFECIFVEIQGDKHNEEISCEILKENNIDFKTTDQVSYLESDNYFWLYVNIKYNDKVFEDRYIEFAKEILSDINKFKKNKDAFDNLDRWINYRWNDRGYYFTFS